MGHSKNGAKGPRGPMGTPHIAEAKYLNWIERKILFYLYRKMSKREYKDYRKKYNKW